MANNKIKTVSAVSNKQILFMTQPYAAVGVLMSATGAEDDKTTGRKIHKAGTPITGDLTARGTEFKAAEDLDTGEGAAVGVLVHDVDVTDGAENATCLIFGFVDLNKLESGVSEKITDNVKKALAGKVTFLK